MGEFGVLFVDWIKFCVVWGYSGVNGMGDVVGFCWGIYGCLIL